MSDDNVREEEAAEEQAEPDASQDVEAGSEVDTTTAEPETEVVDDGADDADVDDVEGAGEEDIPPPPRSIKYTADGADLEFALGDGDQLSDETVERLMPFLTESGLKRKYQERVDANTQLTRELETLRLKAELLEKRSGNGSASDKVVSFIRSNPQLKAAVERGTGKPLPDPDVERLQIENDELKAYKQRQERDEFANAIGAHMAEKLGVSPEVINQVGTYCAQRGLGTFEPGMTRDQQWKRMESIVTDGYHAMVQQNLLPNRKLEELKQEQAKTEKRLKLSQERQAVNNPAAGKTQTTQRTKGKDLEYTGDPEHDKEVERRRLAEFRKKHPKRK